MAKKINNQKTGDNKLCKVFISHSTKDKAFVECLVDLLEFIGIKNNENLFCSSIVGYEIPNSKDIRECLLEQFSKYRPYVIIVHSDNYYSSPYSMNEMGAAWVLGTDFCSLLVKGLDFDKMRGVIGSNYTSIKVDANDAKSRLNRLKDDLISIFQLEGVDQSRWETKRDKFLTDVNKFLVNSPNEEAESDKTEELFKISYLPLLSKLFVDFIDIESYHDWMHFWACREEANISVEQYHKIKSLPRFLQSIDRKNAYEDINSLLINLSKLLNDYLLVCAAHIIQYGEDYHIERFYKLFQDIHEQDEVREKQYKEYCWLISDLSFELTRLLNLLLEKIRGYVPDFLKDYGIMSIDDVDQTYVKYGIKEKTSSPYPGLKQFVEVTRFSRNKHFGNTKDITTLNLL